MLSGDHELMKKTYFTLLSLLLSSGLWYESASAAVAVRRTAIVAQGPYGGAVVAGSRTAIVRPGYGFFAKDNSRQAKNLCEAQAKPTADVKVSH
jgi:hypothetical protein